MIGVVFLALRIALAASLFLFIGWAFYILWKDLRLQAKFISQPRIPTIELVAVHGAPTQSFTFVDPEVIIGRDATCDCRLDEKTISARHTRLYYEMAQWWAEDLHSTNGTLLNNELLSSPMVLTTGDQLHCGEVIFEISIVPLGISSITTTNLPPQTLIESPVSEQGSGG
jgi:pSer/pThr/pTyr-binding forkhead associated (FHA) protein